MIFTFALAGVFIALALFTWQAIHFTSRPSFCASCHEIRSAVDSWERRPHRGISCFACHAQPGQIGFLQRKVGGLVELYRHLTGNFREPLEARVNTLTSCRRSGCHANVNTINGGKLVRFPHNSHLARNLDCLECHRWAAHEPPPGRAAPHLHDVCGNCHTQVRESERCSTCHR